MLSEQQITQFRSEGFLNYENPVVTADELDALRAGLARVLAGESETRPRTDRQSQRERSQRRYAGGKCVGGGAGVCRSPGQ